MESNNILFSLFLMMELFDKLSVTATRLSFEMASW
jgi:hypothetical protein